MCTLEIDSAVIMTMQPSLRTIKSWQPTSKISIWYREQSHVSNTRKKTREQGAGKESESSSFSLPFKASPLIRAFSSHSKWRGRRQSIIFLGNLARSPFGEPVYVRNSEEKFELFTHCQCPLWLHVSFFTHSNQPLTLINNITALTRAWHKENPLIQLIQRPSVRSDSVLLVCGFVGYFTCPGHCCITFPKYFTSPSCSRFSWGSQ